MPTSLTPPRVFPNIASQTLSRPESAVPTRMRYESVGKNAMFRVSKVISSLVAEEPAMSFDLLLRDWSNGVTGGCTPHPTMQHYRARLESIDRFGAC